MYKECFFVCTDFNVFVENDALEACPPVANTIKFSRGKVSVYAHLWEKIKMEVVNSRCCPGTFSIVVGLQIW